MFVLKHFFNGKKFVLLLSLFFSLAGIAASTRQVYLQNNPSDKILSCEPTFCEMFANLPFLEFMSKVFQGDG
jgi:disulfide bond formation protein DsbB